MYETQTVTCLLFSHNAAGKLFQTVGPLTQVEHSLASTLVAEMLEQLSI